MKKQHGLAVFGALAGTTMLLAGPGVAIASSLPDASDNTGTAVSEEASESASYSDYVEVPSVQGEFAFTQNIVTPNSQIASMFNKATSALCASLPNYEIQSVGDWQVSIGGNVQNSFTATIDELSESSSSTDIKGCVCASNVPGGGAAINAEVTGIPMSFIIQEAGINEGVNAITFIALDGTASTLPISYVLLHDAVLAYDINGEDLTESVGAANQLWISSSSGKYFTRDIVEIRFEALEEEPEAPTFETTETDYINRPNVSIAMEN